VQFKAVKAGLSTMAGRTQILEGLSAGDEVIVYSQQALSPGLKVKVVDEIVRRKP
jgi:HlyD family secretion protein